MKLVESGIGVVVAVIMIFALGQGNLKKECERPGGVPA